MSKSRLALRRFGLVAVAGALLSGLLAVPIAAATSSVSGSLTYRERIALTPAAVAIVTIVDTTATPDAGVVIGQQRIDAPSGVPIDFSVLVDAATIDPTHAYALFASIVDGSSIWQNAVGEPVITGGPTKGIDLVLTGLPATPSAIIGGVIVPPSDAVIGPSAVAVTALIKVETGTLVDRQVRPITDPTDLSFAIGFDPSLIDPTVDYVIKGGIVDGSTVWQNRAGAAAIHDGAPINTVNLPVTLAPTGLPVGSPGPSAAPSLTPAPTATPASTANPSATSAVTATPTSTATAAPTATPAPTATAVPTPTATPTPTPSPTPPPAPSGAPTPTPITGPVSGSLTYREPYQLSGDAFAVVALVRGSARATESSIVASEIDRDVSSVPVAFSLDLGSAVVDPSATYTIQATIVDGDNAWVTARGVPVLTKGNPTKVTITLDYRPDVLKGAVTGQVTGVGVALSPTAYALTVLVDPASGQSLGIDVRNASQGLPVAFSVPYSITDIQPTQDYVVTAEVGDAGQTWRNVAGVPVITRGNPKTAVQIVVTPVVVATPTPSATPMATPTPSAAPAPATERPDRDVGFLSIIILIAVIAALAAFFIARGRTSTDTPPPPDGSDATATTTDATATTTDATATTTDATATTTDATATTTEATATTTDATATTTDATTGDAPPADEPPADEPPTRP